MSELGHLRRFDRLAVTSSYSFKRKTHRVEPAGSSIRRGMSYEARD
jgi:hypothetical protein